MAKRRDRCRRPALDPAAVLARLRSPDEQARIKALHSICPCAAGFLPYEQFRTEVKRLQKDPSPRVRAAALHVEHDACQIEAVEAGLDRAEEQGWRYSDPDWVSTHKKRQPPDTGYPPDHPRAPVTGRITPKPKDEGTRAKTRKSSVLAVGECALIMALADCTRPTAPAARRVAPWWLAGIRASAGQDFGYGWPLVTIKNAPSP